VAVLQIDTIHGSARAHLRTAKEPRAALILGHGAGGGIEALDLTAASRAAGAERISVALVEQPYRVAGRRSPPRASQLDADWLSVIERLRAGDFAGLPVIVGGRSLGARVACRTAEAAGAIAVLCLAFPLAPPQRAGKPKQSRLAELEAVNVPTLVVQGERDPFGIPPPGQFREVVKVPGDHGLKTDLEAVAATVQAWLANVVAEAALVP
jgi:predicted alpha/beta-hydrolase family hydrolase